MSSECKFQTVLQAVQGDQELTQVQVVSLLQMGRYEEAVKLAESIGLIFEQAYGLYKLGRFEECVGLCGNRSDPQFITLKAQAVIHIQHFRIGQFEQSVDLYQSLLTNNKETPEQVINLSASLIAPGLYERALQHMTLQGSGDWEVMFNQSCAATELGDFSTALGLLQQATERLVQEESYEDEKILLILQRAYIQQRMQNFDEAKELYQQVLEIETKDKSLYIVALNNILAINETNENFKKLKQALTEMDKLTALQKVGVYLNLSLFYQKRRQMENFERCLAEAEKGGERERVNTIRAYSLFKQKKHEEYREFLLSQGTVQAKLLLAKLYLLKNNVQEAAQIIQQTSDMTSPEITIQIAKLLEDNGNYDKAIEILETAAQSQKSKQI